ncbi:MAG: EthD domain-containing protein [Actinomycetota bacterium]|nr:EthD domain-containing protein [Actinomycetota bacterium]
MKVIAALLGAIPDVAAGLYLPVGEGVTGRTEPVTGIEILRQDQGVPEDAEAYAVDERFQWDRGGDAVSRISFVRRAPHLSREEFADHWTNVHAPLARKHHPVLARYVQNVVVEKLTPDAPEVDGIAELGFRTMRDVHHRNYDSPAGAAIIRRDIQRFLDVPAGWRMLAKRA